MTQGKHKMPSNCLPMDIEINICKSVYSSKVQEHQKTLKNAIFGVKIPNKMCALKIMQYFNWLESEDGRKWLTTSVPDSSSLSTYKLHFQYVREAAALSLLYPSVTQMTNLPKLSPFQHLPHMLSGTYGLRLQRFQSSCEQKSASSSLL